jgi:hypothetical protein
MSRYYVGFTQRGPTVLRNVRKAPTGDILFLIEEDEVKSLQLDYTGFLESGETVSASALASENVTASATVSSPTVTIEISEAEVYDLTGRIVVVTTLSTGRKVRTTIRARRKNNTAEEFDTSYT